MHRATRKRSELTTEPSSSSTSTGPSSSSGPDLTVVQLRAAGLKAAVTRRRRIALGPVLRGRERWLRERGLLPAADDKEELVVVRAELPV